MEWLVVALIGAIIGTIVSFVAQGIRMPQSLTILLAVVGALAGASLDRVTGFNMFGTFTFYIAGAALSIGFLAGGILAYSLVSEETRV